MARVSVTSLLDQTSHTGRELELMLAGRKPLAWFTHVTKDGRVFEQAPEAEFDVQVAAGRFVKQEFTEHPDAGVSVRHILYALAGEAWRIPAMRLALREMGRMPHPDEGMDRVIGALLGYTEAEIDLHVCVREHVQPDRNPR